MAFKPLINTTQLVRENTKYEGQPQKAYPLVTRLELYEDTLKVNDQEFTVSNSVTTEEIINILAALS